MSDYKSQLDDLMLAAASRGASDLHLSVGYRPALRIDGALVPLSDQPLLKPDMTEGMIMTILSPEKKEELLREQSVDFAYSFDEKARFRVNAFYQRGYLSAAFRLIPAQVRTIDDLNLPSVLHDFTKLSQGFVLVVGPAGHGKSTTLAAMIDEINEQRMEHIIAVEDPIEYLFNPKRSMVSQREVKIDTPTFEKALTSVLRQDPDVIMVGEMRGVESIATAMTAAETGHLVFSTLHTNSAAQTVDRIIDSFPAEQQAQVASQLAATLVAIVSERLIPRIGGGRVPACEIMIANAAVRNLIRERKAHQIDLVIETSSKEGMVSLNRSLVDLVKKKIISPENAFAQSLNLSELKVLLGRI